MTIANRTKASINPSQTPTYLHNPRTDETAQSNEIRYASEDNKICIISSSSAQDTSSNRHACEATEAYDGVKTSIPSTEDFCPA